MVLTPAARGRLDELDERLALTLYRYLLGGRPLALPDTAQYQEDPHGREENR